MAIDLGPDGLTLGSTTINDWDDVGGSTTFGAVGTYALLMTVVSGTTTVGSTRSGSDLMYGTNTSAANIMNISCDINAGSDYVTFGQSGAPHPSGTWRNMGMGVAASSNTSDTTGRKTFNVWVRTA